MSVDGKGQQSNEPAEEILLNNENNVFGGYLTLPKY
jgi:hypothetical protein